MYNCEAGLGSASAVVGVFETTPTMVSHVSLGAWRGLQGEGHATRPHGRVFEPAL